MDRRVVFSHVDLLRCATPAAQAISTTPAQGVFHTALAVSAYGLKPIQHQHLSTEDHVLGHECGYSNPWGPRLRSDPEQKPWRPCRYGQLHKMRQCVCVCVCAHLQQLATPWDMNIMHSSISVGLGFVLNSLSGKSSTFPGQLAPHIAHHLTVRFSNHKHQCHQKSGLQIL